MLMRLAVGSLLMCGFSGVAQTPTLPATDLTGADIQAFLKALPPDAVNDKPIRVVDVGGYHVAVYGVLRPKSVGRQEANVHQTKVSEIYYILEGGGTLVTGGTLPNPKPMAPGSTNLQGSRIDGGVSRHLSKGDVVIIPGRTPHWWSNQDGDLKYLIFRTDPDSKIPLK
jgi:mannose-6-phosphate isomerase-like protein (cupin superfamily)